MTHTPTPEQAAIIKAAGGSQSILINALAGSGKTTTLVNAAENLPVGLTPSQALLGIKGKTTLAIAFNTRIKDELTAKLPAHIKTLTFNGLGHRVLAQNIEPRLTLHTSKTYKIIQNLIKNNPAKRKLFTKNTYSIMLRVIADCKQLLIDPRPMPTGMPMSMDLFDRILAEYDIEPTQALHSITNAILLASLDQAINEGIIDFGDQIWIPLLLNLPFPTYDTILIDEAQDLSYPNQQQVLNCHPSRLLIFGDRHQSIYAFRGADPESMDNLAKGSNAVSLPLNISFRCPKAVCDVVRHHVPDIQAHPSNPEGIVDTLGQWSLNDLGRTDVILCRNNAPLLRVASLLMQSGVIPKILGKDLGKALLTQLTKIKDNAITPKASIENFFGPQIAKARHGRKKRLIDQCECLQAILSTLPSPTLTKLADTISRMFESDHGTITLSTGHKSKGLEWDTVWHLDRFLINTENGDTQEANLLYVINTRSKNKLFFVKSENLLENTERS